MAFEKNEYTGVSLVVLAGFPCCSCCLLLGQVLFGSFGSEAGVCLPHASILQPHCLKPWVWVFRVCAAPLYVYRLFYLRVVVRLAYTRRE